MMELCGILWSRNAGFCWLSQGTWFRVLVIEISKVIADGLNKNV